MHKSVVLSLAALVCSVAGRTQDVKASAAAAPKASYAYARGENTYLLYAEQGYNKDKKYAVFTFYKEEEPLSDGEKTALAELKTQLAKKNVELREVQWKSEQDLANALKGYGIQVESTSGKYIRLKGEGYSMNTTATKAVVVVEDGRPVSLCSGGGCEDRLESFFRIKVHI